MYKLDLSFMAFGAIRCGVVMTFQTLDSRPVNLPVLLTCRMAGVAVQYPCDMLPVWKRKSVDPDLGIFKAPMAFATLRVRDLQGLWQRNSLLGMAGRA